MYKNLDARALGVSGRQSELIELGLTYGFRGLELDILDMWKRVRNSSLEHATRFVRSADMNIGGFPLAIPWDAEEAALEGELKNLAEMAAIGKELKAACCHYVVQPGSDEQPYHENFELHRDRLGRVAEVLGQHDIPLALGFRAADSYRREFQFQFIHQPEDLLTLVKTIGMPNVGLKLDSWNWFVGGGSLAQIQELTAEQIAYVTLADAPDEEALEELTEEMHRKLPGEGGRINCADIVAHLGKVSYEGPVTLVPSPKIFAGRTRDGIVQKAGEILQDQWRTAGLTKSGKPAAPAEATPSP